MQAVTFRRVRNFTLKPYVLLFCAGAIGGCDDALTSITPPAHRASSAPAGYSGPPIDEFRLEDRFTFGIDVQGSLKPGHPIHLTLRGKANFAAKDADVRLTLPEVSAAGQSGWALVELPVGEVSKPQIQMRRAFAAGEEFRERATVTIPEPGYYFVVATAKQYSHDGLTDRPHQVTDVSTRPLWIWIDERGGRVTEQFDTTVFAPNVRQERGPRASKDKAPRVKRKGDAYITCTIYPNDPGVIIVQACPGTNEPPPPPPAGTNTHAFRATYDNLDQGHSFTPIPNAKIAWRVTVAGSGAVVAAGESVTDAQGNIPAIDCQGTNTERIITAQVHTVDQRVSVRYRDIELAGTWTGVCGGVAEIVTDPLMAHLFANLQKTVLGHANRFLDYPAKRISAGMYDDGKTYYAYNHPEGELHFFHDGSIVWGGHGAFVAAHEYGHHYQDRYLFQYPDRNGLMRMVTSACPAKHPPENATTLGCAWGEAFADWYAVLVRGSATGRWLTDLESNWSYLNCVPGYTLRGDVVCSSDGSIVQGAIAAFLHDLTDQSPEAHDSHQMLPASVADAITKCQVHPKSRALADYISYTGIDHLIYCWENRKPYQVEFANQGWKTFFNTRPQADWPDRVLGAVLASSSDPFRRTWLVNLYSKRPEVSTSPTFRDAAPEDPGELEPEPEPELEPCYTDENRPVICPIR